MFRYLDPDTLVIVTLPDVPGPDRLPPCPVCGATIVQEIIDVSTWDGPAYIEGRWECPNDCNPRDGDPRWTGR